VYFDWMESKGLKAFQNSKWRSQNTYFRWMTHEWNEVIVVVWLHVTQIYKYLNIEIDDSHFYL
jgi:hypothetical protein